MCPRRTELDEQEKRRTAEKFERELIKQIDTKMAPPNDPVNHPKHYTQGGVECIDGIASCIGPDSFSDFCRGNAMKYIWRFKDKGGSEDIRKAIWYLNKIIEVTDKTS